MPETGREPPLLHGGSVRSSGLGLDAEPRCDVGVQLEGEPIDDGRLLGCQYGEVTLCHGGIDRRREPKAGVASPTELMVRS